MECSGIVSARSHHYACRGPVSRNANVGTTALEAEGLQRHSVGRRPLSTSRRHDDLATGNPEIIADSRFMLALAQGNLLGM